MKQFSPSYLIKSAYNAAANEVARQMVSQKYGTKFAGTKMNQEANILVRDGLAVPTREQFTTIFKSLCIRHGVVFEGGVDAFVAGAWEISNSRN